MSATADLSGVSAMDGGIGPSNNSFDHELDNSSQPSDDESEEEDTKNTLIPNCCRITAFLRMHGYASVHLLPSDVDALTK
jgi:hypothetical protein